MEPYAVQLPRSSGSLKVFIDTDAGDDCFSVWWEQLYFLQLGRATPVDLKQHRKGEKRCGLVDRLKSWWGMEGVVFVPGDNRSLQLAGRRTTFSTCFMVPWLLEKIYVAVHNTSCRVQLVHFANTWRLLAEAATMAMSTCPSSITLQIRLPGTDEPLILSLVGLLFRVSLKCSMLARSCWSYTCLYGGDALL